MARDGSGVHSLPAGYLAVTGQTVLPSNHNPPLEDLSAAITESIARTGVTAIVADIPFAGFRLTAVGDATADTDALNRQTADDRYLFGGKGLLHGFTLSNNGADANNDIDIATGTGKDETGAVNITLASGITKRLDGSWAVGTGNGGLDTGSKAAASFYHVWLIYRSDTQLVDALFSLSATAPTMPASYDYKRRIGCVVTNGSGNIYAFTQTGDYFVYNTPIQDAVNVAVSAVTTDITLSVPRGVKVEAISRVSFTSASATSFFLIQDKSEANAAANVTAGNFSLSCPVSGQFGAGEFRIMTDTTAGVRVSSSAAGNYYIVTKGWIDRRGRDA